MHIEYGNKKTEEICTNLHTAKRKYPEKVAIKLMRAINFIENAESLQDVIRYGPFNFHDLKGDRKGQYAIDIDGRRGSYRIVLKPVDESSTDIYATAKSIKIVLVWEVSKHYE